MTSASGPHAWGVAAIGIDEAQRELLRAILVVLEQRAQRPWRLCAPGDADLVLHPANAAVTVAPGTLRGLFLREGEAPSGAGQLQLPLPLRVMTVLETLNTAHDQLQLRESCPAVEAADNAAPADDGRALAAALARLAPRRADHALRIRIVGFGTLWVDGLRRQWRADFPPARLREALEQHRYVMTAVADGSVCENAGPARAIEELHWCTGLISPWECAERDALTFRLLRWPDLAQWPHLPWHVSLCATLSAAPRTIAGLAGSAGAPLAEASHFLHACVLAGLAEGTRTVVTDPAPAPARRGPGLFERLRLRLGF